MASNDNKPAASEQANFLDSAVFRFQAFHRDWLTNVKHEGGVPDEDLVSVLHNIRQAEESARSVIDARLSTLKAVA